MALLVNGQRVAGLGKPGVGIKSIERTGGDGTPGTTDTYTITLTDGSTAEFYVYNGKDGTGAGDMSASVYDPDDAVAASGGIAQYVDGKMADIPTPDVSGQIADHNEDETAHQDIRDAIPTNPEDIGAEVSGSASKALEDAKRYADEKIALAIGTAIAGSY